MSALKESGKNKINSTGFRRKLIMIVKEHPSVWNNNKNETYDSFHRLQAWKLIEKELGFPCELKELQAVWASLSEIYFRIIFIRTIERNFEAPVWTFFHDMTFLYDHVKETIQNQLGGISPPLFIPKSVGKRSQKPPCPCCAYIGPHLDSKPDKSSTKFKEEKEFANIVTAYSEASLDSDQDNIQNSIGSVDSRYSFDTEYSEIQSSLFTNSPDSQHNDDGDSLAEPTSHYLMNDKICEVTGLRDNNETNSDSLKSKIPRENRTNVKCIESSGKICNPVRENNSIGPNNFLEILKPQSPGISELASYSLTINDCLRDDCSLPEDESSSIEQIQSPGLSETTTDGDDKSILNDKSNNSKNSNGEYTKYSPIERSKIIEAIKAYPAIYLKNVNKKSAQFNNAWNRVGKELGNVPLQTLKSRWKLIKTRYLKELVFERYSNGKQKSTWEFFDQLEFLRPHMQEDFDEVNRTRMEMREAIKKKAKESPFGANYNSELEELIDEDARNSISATNNIQEKDNDQAKFCKNQTISKSNVNTDKEEFNADAVKNSTREYFNQLDFLHPHVHENIDDANRKQTQMKDKTRKKSKECTSIPQEPIAEERTKKTSNISHSQEKENDQAKYCNSQNNNVSYVNTNQKIQIINVESVKKIKDYCQKPKLVEEIQIVNVESAKQMKEHCQKPKQVEQPLVFDENTLAILKNRPVKVTAIKIIPSLDHTNEEYKDKLNDNTEAQPPAKKLRKSTCPDKNETNLLQNETPVKLPSAPAPCFTLDLTTDEATIEPVKTDKPKRLKNQKVFPPLDLTLDDDVGETVPRPNKKFPTSKIQQVVDEFVNTNKIFPTLDLTTDEKDESKNANKSVYDIASKRKNEKEKDDENVICLDDDDSVDSYEEVIVYVLEKDKN